MKDNIDFQEIVKNYPFSVAGASFIQPGLGQILVGRIRRGISFLFPRFILLLFLYILGILNLLGFDFQLNDWFVSITIYGLPLVVRVISVYDAYKIAKEL